MSINTKIRLTILASVLALTAAAPAAFAQGAGTTYRPEGAKTDTAPGSNTEQVTQKKGASSTAARDTGTPYRPEGGTPDATAERQTKKVMHKKTHKKMHRKMHKRTAPSYPASPAAQEQPGVPKY